MEKIDGQIAGYNIINYLIPGLFFIITLEHLCNLKISNQNIWTLLVQGYIVGIVLSRIGSICIEPLFRKVKLVKYVSKEKFFKVEQKDKKLQELLADNNMYRTMCASCIVLAIAKMVIKCFEFFNVHEVTRWIIGLFLLFIVFVMAYRRQTKKIHDRVATEIKINEF